MPKLPVSEWKLDDSREKLSLKCSQNQHFTQLSLFTPMILQRLSTWFGVARFSLHVWSDAWVLPSDHMYHDHLLKYARIALGTGLEDHFYRQNTRVSMYDIIMQSQALQENSFSEVRFRVCQLFLKAVSLLAFLFPEK